MLWKLNVREVSNGVYVLCVWVCLCVRYSILLLVAHVDSLHLQKFNTKIYINKLTYCWIKSLWNDKSKMLIPDNTTKYFRLLIFEFIYYY